MWLTAERLLLREFTPEDWPDVYAYRSDPEVVRYLPFGPASVEEVQDHLTRCMALARSHPRRVHELAVVVRAEERVIGSCALAQLDYEPRHASFMDLFHRRFWGRGSAAEAMRARFEYGFEVLGLHRYAILAREWRALKTT